MKEDKVFIFDILDAILRIYSYLKGVSFQQFLKNTEKQDAVVRNLEIIGEAANKFSDVFRQANPHISWRSIINMRNKLIHAYDSVDVEIVWDVCQKELLPLKKSLTKILKGK